jgi:hypothetical protein
MAQLALDAASVTGLGVPGSDDAVGWITVGTWPDLEKVKLRWNVGNRTWTSDPIVLGRSIDQDPLIQPEVDWAFMDAAGNQQGAMMIRTIPHAGEFFAAGLKLQDRSMARMWAANSGEGVKITAWFYEFNDGDFVMFGNDFGNSEWPRGSGHYINNPPGGYQKYSDSSTTFHVPSYGDFPYTANIGKGNDLTSVGNDVSNIKIPQVGWQNVSFFQPTIDGTLGSTPYTPTKKYLYPTFYGARTGASGNRTNILDPPVSGGNAAVAMYTYEMRWYAVVP